jgi:hypothetical protein
MLGGPACILQCATGRKDQWPPRHWSRLPGCSGGIVRGIPHSPSQNGRHRPRAEHEIEVALVNTGNHAIAGRWIEAAVVDIQLRDVDRKTEVLHVEDEARQPRPE